jgi:hypothetical protein
MVTLEKLEEQEITSFLFNESENSLSNNKIIEILIPSIDFDRNKYKLFSIFIHYCPNLLVLTKMNESDINKKSINFKQRLPWIFQNALQSSKVNKWLKIMQRKYNSIIENKIYILVNLLKGRKTIKGK